MGWFDGRSSSRRSSSYRSPYSTHHSRHSAPSIFSLGGGGGGGSRSRSHYGSSSSIFSFSSSPRRARPRSGFIHRVIHQIKRILRDIFRYARRHPIKVFFLVVMPLLTSGVLPKLFAMIGLRIPKGLLGGGIGRALGAGGDIAGSGGIAEGAGGLMSIAKNFL